MTAFEPEPAAAWFWVMTLTWPTKPGSFTVNTQAGTGIWPPRVGRRTAFEQTLARASEAAGVPEGAPVNVLYFHLEPDPDATPDQRRQAETGTVNIAYDRGRQW